MLGKIKPNFQQNLFQTRLTDLIYLMHLLVILFNTGKMVKLFECILLKIGIRKNLK
jgi:hypothetical protein